MITREKASNQIVSVVISGVTSIAAFPIAAITSCLGWIQRQIEEVPPLDDLSEAGPAVGAVLGSPGRHLYLVGSSNPQAAGARRTPVYGPAEISQRDWSLLFGPIQ